MVHLFNLMEPQDDLFANDECQKANKKIALSTIYGLYTEFERKARGGFFQKTANILSPYQIGYIKIVVKHYFEKRFHKGVLIMLYKGYFGMMKKITKNTNVFLPNSISKMNRVVSDFNLKNYNFVSIPNAIDKSIFSQRTETNTTNKFLQYKDCIVCADHCWRKKQHLI